MDARWELYPTDHVKPSYLCETLEQKKNTKKKQKYIRISPSKATAERSFSLLKRVKTYLCVTL
jgi:hypothetical protein